MALSDKCKGGDPQVLHTPNPSAPKSHAEWVQQQQTNKAGENRLWAEIAKGCSGSAMVENLLGTWVLTVEGGAGLDLLAMFPNDRNKIKRVLNELGAGDPVPYRDFLEAVGACE